LHSLENKSKLNSGNACYYAVQNLFVFYLISKTIRIRKYKTKILHAVLYGCKIWSLMSKEENKLKVFEKKVVRSMYEPNTDEMTGA
jgi:hypothetical protein